MVRAKPRDPACFIYFFIVITESEQSQDMYQVHNNILMLYHIFQYVKLNLSEYILVY